MSYIYRTLVAPANLAPMAQSLCEMVAGPPGAGMFSTGLSANGTGPATHYISAGPIDDSFAAVLSDPAFMFAACEAAGVAVTLEACQDLLAACDVSDEPAFVALERLGLRLVQPEGT